MNRRIALYKLFDREAAPVYFGISNDPRRRLRRHRRRKLWWPEVDEARTVIVWFDSRDAAGAAELAAIRAEAPRHNTVTSDVAGCSRFLPRLDGRAWGRPRWVGQASPEVLAEIADLVAFRQNLLRTRSVAVAKLAKLAAPEGRNVPIAHLAERLGVERKTVYRHLGRSMT